MPAHVARQRPHACSTPGTTVCARQHQVQQVHPHEASAAKAVPVQHQHPHCSKAHLAANCTKQGAQDTKHPVYIRMYNCTHSLQIANSSKASTQSRHASPAERVPMALAITCCCPKHEWMPLTPQHAPAAKLGCMTGLRLQGSATDLMVEPLNVAGGRGQQLKPKPNLNLPLTSWSSCSM